MTDRLIGHVHYDGRLLNNDEVHFLVVEADCERVKINKYVKVLSKTGKRASYIGRISRGPFYIPEEVSRDSALTQTSILYGRKFNNIPPYYGLGAVTLLGEYTNGRLENLSDRPGPQSEVVDLSTDEIAELILPTEGADMVWGSLSGYPEVLTKLPSGDKRLLPRNIGIFGTVGSGKTNSSQVLIEEALCKGYAVVVLDVEGEYVSMNSHMTETKLAPLLPHFGLTPQGVSDFRLYHPVSSDPNSQESSPFTVKTNEIDILNLAEIIEATEPQERRLFEVMEEVKSRFAEQKKEKIASATVRKGSLAAELTKSAGRLPYGLKEIIGWARKKAEEAKGADKHSFYALIGKLNRLDRTRCFDVPGTPSLNMQEMIVPGRLSVIDTSDCYSDPLKNIIIFTTLRKVFNFKLDSRYHDCKTLVVIEEAHSYISKEKARSMQETLDVLREIARRGRKRWLGLCFISQQPSHLPPEIFELCNTRIIHNLKSKQNINALKYTSGGISEDLWNSVPCLSAGHALVSSPVLKNSIIMRFRPAATARKFVD